MKNKNRSTLIHLNGTLIGLLLIVISVTFSCNDNTSKDPGENTNDTGTLLVNKEKIKDFWEYYRLAQKYRVEGNWEFAVQYYEKALAVNSDHEDAQFNLGNMYLELNRYAEAERCWLRVIEIYPNSARAHLQLGRLYLSYERPEIFDLEKAKTQFLVAFESNKIVTGPLLLLGHVALLEGDIEDAEQYFLSVIGSDRKSVEAHYLLGYISWKKGDINKARDFFDLSVSNSEPEKAIEGVLSEGDTKDGISHLRPINQSLFYRYFSDLQNDNLIEMNESYKMLDNELVEIQRSI